MKTVKELRRVQTLEDLENLGIGDVSAEISYRGGGIGFSSYDVAEHFQVQSGDLPRKFGAGCNYLGGGLRGSIFASTFSNRIEGKKIKLLYELARACVRVYENIENDAHLNDETDEDGETNWEAMGTNISRNAGIISAY